MRTIIRVIKGDTRNLDYSSHGPFSFELGYNGPFCSHLAIWESTLTSCSACFLEETHLQ